MADNLYAPPIPAVTLRSQNRPFFKSGAGILFVSLTAVTMVSFLLAFFSSLFFGIIVVPYASESTAVAFNQVEPLVRKFVHGTALSFVPYGMWLFGQDLHARMTSVPKWPTTTAVFLAVMTAVLYWSSNVAWFFELEMHGNLTIASGLLQTISIVAILFAIYRISGHCEQRALQRLSLVAIAFALVSHVVMVYLPIGSMGSLQVVLIEVALTLWSYGTLLFAVWSARKLEDAPAH